LIKNLCECADWIYCLNYDKIYIVPTNCIRDYYLFPRIAFGAIIVQAFQAYKMFELRQYLKKIYQKKPYEFSQDFLDLKSTKYFNNNSPE
jgi:hypothetical protein